MSCVLWQVHAFLRGFRDLIPIAWIRMFDAEELQLLLTGKSTVSLSSPLGRKALRQKGCV